MKLLVSLCNKIVEPIGPPFLLEVDTVSEEITPIFLDDSRVPPPLGFSGLCPYREGFLAALQTEPTTLLQLSREYQVENVWTLTRVKDARSLAVFEDKIYLVSTGNDAIVEFAPDSEERIFWRANHEGKDSIHLNSLAWHEGNLYATAFGKKKGDSWSSADAGFLQNLTTGTCLCEALMHPHSLLVADDGFYFCRSRHMSVGKPDGQDLEIGVGYTRGLCVSGEYIWVGVSRGRASSKSLGKVVENPQDSGLLTGLCGVVMYRRNADDLSKSELIGAFWLEDYRTEIYDILPLENT